MTAVLAVLLGLAGLLGYAWGVHADRLGGWPRRRIGCWVAGTLAVLISVTGSLPEIAHHDFAAHMVTHLLIGMLGPLLLVLAAPVTLALRALPVRRGRQLTRILGSRPLRLLTDPFFAAGLNVGGLWLLYTTSLFTAMHDRPLVHLLVHAHLVASGYLFTQAILGVDPLPHRRSFPARAAVLVAAGAGHSILAKYLYAHPPAGLMHAEVGAMTMYYGGDVIEVMLIVLLCARWYRWTGRRLEPPTAATPINGPPVSGGAWAAPHD